MPEPNMNSPGACPDLSVIAAYVDGTLDETARTGLHRHLAACDVCAELVAEVVISQDAGNGVLIDNDAGNGAAADAPAGPATAPQSRTCSRTPSPCSGTMRSVGAAGRVWCIGAPSYGRHGLLARMP